MTEKQDFVNQSQRDNGNHVVVNSHDNHLEAPISRPTFFKQSLAIVLALSSIRASAFLASPLLATPFGFTTLELCVGVVGVRGATGRGGCPAIHAAGVCRDIDAISHSTE
jgi:hypothetical protein